MKEQFLISFLIAMDMEVPEYTNNMSSEDYLEKLRYQVGDAVRAYTADHVSNWNTRMASLNTITNHAQLPLPLK